ncbi:DUF2793 domain-containing protein [Alteriqipengyuania sp.]|uniref:DUF2793 domain-containing protein n=1 Tax=Alteriqipengyuania sp. TaxID=2800692 RepID=UPI0035138AB4
MSTPLVFTARSPRVALPYLFAAQAQKEATVNEGLARIDALLTPAVEEIASSPPASPSEGQCWIISANPQGDWAGRENDMAVFTAGTWLFVNPQVGMAVFDKAAGVTRRWDGGWNAPAIPASPSGGSTIDAEARAAIDGLIDTLRDAGVGV